MKKYTDLQGNRYTDHHPNNKMERIESHDTEKVYWIEELDYCSTEKERNENPKIIELYDDEGGGGVEYLITRIEKFPTQK